MAHSRKRPRGAFSLPRTDGLGAEGSVDAEASPVVSATGARPVGPGAPTRLPCAAASGARAALLVLFAAARARGAYEGAVECKREALYSD